MAQPFKSRTKSEEETGYLASIADLMSGLLFIFIITLMVFALTYAEQRKITEQEKRQYTDAQRAKEDLLRQIEEKLKQQGVKIVVNVDQGVLRLGESILFEKAKADLNVLGIETVKTLAEAMAEVLPCFTPDRPIEGCTEVSQFGFIDAIFIEGHTDKDPYNGTAFIDNYDLSTTRAHNVYFALKNERQELDSLMNLRAEKVLSISGYGEDRPLPETDDSEESKRKNRRIDIRFVLHPVGDQKTEPQKQIEQKLKN